MTMLNKQQEAILSMNNSGLGNLFEDETAIDEVSIDDMFILLASALHKVDNIEIAEREYDGVLGIRVKANGYTLFDVYPEPYDQTGNEKWALQNKVSHFRLIKVHADKNLSREILDVYSQVNPQKYMPTAQGVMIYEDINLRYGKSAEEISGTITCFYRNSIALATANMLHPSSVN